MTAARTAFTPPTTRSNRPCRPIPDTSVENTTAVRKSFKASLTRIAGKQKPPVALEIWDEAGSVYIRLAKPKEQTSA